MQVASHQMMNEHFESKVKITPEKNEAKTTFIFFSGLHGTRGFAKIYPFLHVLRPVPQRY